MRRMGGLLKQYECDVDAPEIINVHLKSKLKNFARKNSLQKVT